MNYRIVVHKRVAAYLQRLPEMQRERIKAAIRSLENNPTNVAHVKPMLGEWAGYWRLRIGDWRVIYWVNTVTIYVDYIGSRGDVYK
jgi:mRNA interferase RelE/StbE